ncbi:MAG: hypothetical protein HQM04_18435 [Magnetococcales bacterium]|nr:hypothetical protein [Magnetococcales bacterium]MBF0117007.1 hypothetical protein [Magnetococcales bacterium]
MKNIILFLVVVLVAEFLVAIALVGDKLNNINLSGALNFRNDPNVNNVVLFYVMLITFSLLFLVLVKVVIDSFPAKIEEGNISNESASFEMNGAVYASTVSYNNQKIISDTIFFYSLRSKTSGKIQFNEWNTDLANDEEVIRLAGSENETITDSGSGVQRSSIGINGVKSGQNINIITSVKFIESLPNKSLSRSGVFGKDFNDNDIYFAYVSEDHISDLTIYIRSDTIQFRRPNNNDVSVVRVEPSGKEIVVPKFVILDNDNDQKMFSNSISVSITNVAPEDELYLKVGIDCIKINDRWVSWKDVFNGETI